MKVQRFSGDTDEYERRAARLIGREVSHRDLFYLVSGHVVGWRWWVDNHLRAEVLQVQIKTESQGCHWMNIDYVKELK